MIGYTDRRAQDRIKLGRIRARRDHVTRFARTAAVEQRLFFLLSQVFAVTVVDYLSV